MSVVADPSRAIMFKVLHLFCVAVMLSFIKMIEGLPVFELMFFRALLALLPIAGFLALRGELRASIRTERPFGHLSRALLSMTTMGMTFVAVRALPLPEAVTLQYTQPLFVVALSALLLGERVHVFRWGAVAFGFIGVLVLTWPRLTLLSSGAPISGTEMMGAGAALIAALALALNLLVVGQLVRTEKSSTIALWLGFYASILLGLTMPFGWVVPSPGQFGLLVCVGIAGGLGQLTLSESLRFAPASTTAPFEYTSLIFAIGFGYFLFGDVPDLRTLSGGGILVAAGLAILWRERRRSLRPSIPRSRGMPPE